MKRNKYLELQNSHYLLISHNFLHHKSASKFLARNFRSLKICSTRTAVLRKASQIMQFRNSKASKGSSLVETLIYAAILGMVAIFTTDSILAMMNSYSHVKVSRNLNASISVAMDRMTNEIRMANNIDDAGSAFATSSGKLKLNTIDSAGVPTTVEFFLTGNAVFVKDSFGLTEALTSSSTEITNFNFNKITISGVGASKAVKLNLTAKAKNGRMEKTENFYNTTILRGSY